MKAAKDRCEEYDDPARRENIQGRTKTRLELFEEHLKDPIVALEKALVAWRIPTGADLWFEGSRGTSCGLQWHTVVCVPRFCRRCGNGTTGKASAFAWTHGTVCACAQHPPLGCLGRVWAAWRALLLLFQTGAGGGFCRRAVQALCLCGNAQVVRPDWFAPFGREKVKMDQVVVSLLIKET